MLCGRNSAELFLEDEVEDLIRQVRQTMEQYHMTAGGCILAGVSGGADSVCLLCVLKELSEQMGYSLCAVHVEHGIRGEESLADMRYVQRLCAGLGVPLTVRHADIPRLALSSGRGLEEEARVRRYEIFREEARHRSACRIAVAHTMNDQAETVLWHLARGTDLKGLCGIRPVRVLETGQDGKETLTLIRPLLFVSRARIEAYLQEKGISFCTDRTNLDKAITRNRIRLDVIPSLQLANERVLEHISSAAESLSEAEAYLDRKTKEACGACLSAGGEGGREVLIDLDSFLPMDGLIRKRVLREAVRTASGDRGLKDIGRSHIDALMHLCEEPQAKRTDLPGALAAVRSGRYVTVAKEGELQKDSGTFPVVHLELPFEGEKEVTAGGLHFLVSCGTADSGLFPVPEKKYTKWLAYDTISHELCLRSRRAGDYLIADRAGGRKKLSDYMTDRKIPGKIRDRIVVAAQGSHILWVVGGRICEGAKLAPGQRYVKIALKGREEKEGTNEGEYPCADSAGKGGGADPAAG